MFLEGIPVIGFANVQLNHTKKTSGLPSFFAQGDGQFLSKTDIHCKPCQNCLFLKMVEFRLRNSLPPTTHSPIHSPRVRTCRSTFRGAHEVLKAMQDSTKGFCFTTWPAVFWNVPVRDTWHMFAEQGVFSSLKNDFFCCLKGCLRLFGMS